MASGEAPTDDNMTRTLVNKPMVLKLGVWEIEIQGENKSGNWIQAVSPRNAQAKKEPEKKPEPKPSPQDEFDDSIPF